MSRLSDLPVLVIHDPSESLRTVRAGLEVLLQKLREEGLEIISAEGREDGAAAIAAHPEIGAVILEWAGGAIDLASDPDSFPYEFLDAVHSLFTAMPVFLLTESMTVVGLPTDVLERLAGWIWIGEDTPAFIAGRVRHAVERYRDSLLPPFFAELLRYVDENRYSWHTPGHMGGLAFWKSPVGRQFFNFFGENVLRSDLSSSVRELGSVLEHEGVVRQAEENAARVFGADVTYFVTNGTTMSNQIVFRATVTSGDVVLLDRNSHKSIVNSVIQTGAIPVWLMPTRNEYGMIGPLRPEGLSPGAVERALADHPLLTGRDRPAIRLAVVTNSTYDGTIYNVDRLVEQLGAVTDIIHFDEAWIPYAVFHPFYANHYGMAIQSGSSEVPTVVTTMSPHKMLAAFSQASMIHIRQGRKPLPVDRFNEAFMLHTSTSPQYAIIASLDVATRMMEGTPGRHLIDEAICESIAFREEMGRIRSHYTSQGEWWFDLWQPENLDEIHEHEVVLTNELWEMRPGDSWHGFGDTGVGATTLDPLKVSVITPGLGPDGTPGEHGIPAALLSTFLRVRGVVVEKTGYYSILVLFSIAVTKGKSEKLLAELLEFKKLFDANAPISEVLPELATAHSGRYRDLGLADLAARMHLFLSSYDTAAMQEAIFSRLPTPAMTPSEAFQHLVRGEVEHIPLAFLDGRIAAVLCLSYPPGIPVIVPGERFDSAVHPIVEYLQLFELWDEHFPGFRSEIQGVVRQRNDDGQVRYAVSCVVHDPPDLNDT